MDLDFYSSPAEGEPFGGDTPSSAGGYGTPRSHSVSASPGDYGTPGTHLSSVGDYGTPRSHLSSRPGSAPGSTLLSPNTLGTPGSNQEFYNASSEGGTSGFSPESGAGRRPGSAPSTPGPRGGGETGVGQRGARSDAGSPEGVAPGGSPGDGVPTVHPRSSEAPATVPAAAEPGTASSVGTGLTQAQEGGAQVGAGSGATDAPAATAAAAGAAAAGASAGEGDEAGAIAEVEEAEPEQREWALVEDEDLDFALSGGAAHSPRAMWGLSRIAEEGETESQREGLSISASTSGGPAAEGPGAQEAGEEGDGTVHAASSTASQVGRYGAA